MARIMVPKVSGLALVHYSQEPFKWHEIINEEKKIPSNCIMQNKKKFESMIYILAKNNLLSLSVTTISWGYNLTKFYLGSHYILSYISTYYLTQPIPSTPARRKKKPWRSIYNSFFYFILTMIEIVVEECKKNLSKQQ